MSDRLISVACLTLACVFVAPRTSSQDVEEGWVTHSAALSPKAGITILGKMHAEKGTSWLVIRDLAKNKERQRLRHGGPIRSMAFSLDGSRFVTSHDSFGAHVFISTTCKKIADLKGHKSWVWVVALSPDGKLAASGGRDGTMRLWNVDKAQEIWKRSFEKQVGKLAFTADGKHLLAAHHNGPLEIWNLKGQVVATLAEDAGATWGLAESADGGFLVTGHNSRWIKVWDLAKRNLHKKFQIPDGRIYSVAISPDHERVACSTSNRAVHEFAVATAKLIRTVKIPKDKRNILNLTYDNALGLVGADYDGHTIYMRPKKTATRPSPKSGKATKKN